MEVKVKAEAEAALESTAPGRLFYIHGNLLLVSHH
jgi:hypothetical protein